ncbi:acyl-CoA N-acyltransferase [Aspergillus avenaceus]|uniref:Acyl-CoA N-acyltransferase n=1 Tax=Aspergillus avenaceus TaxID=36643 RepID=A0A5N6U688_ASPAV|nr:acyl-CoA N-acyltransferase [Aspergillus avenaceus]
MSIVESVINMECTQIQLRLAVPQDLPFIAEVAAQAMLNDELFAFLCPRRKDYYSDYRRGFLRRLRTKLKAPGWVIVVAVVNSPAYPSTDSMHIVGYSVWERIGESTEAGTGKQGEVEQGWLNNIQENIWDLGDQLFSWLYPDRSVDRSHLAAYSALTEECFPYSAYPKLWFLSTLAVHPDYQRQGIGRKLVEWGLGQAAREQMPVGLEASAKGTYLYHSLGFRTVNEMPLIENITLRAMIWDLPKDAHN